MRYLVLSHPDAGYAEAISALLWQVQDGAALGGADRYCGWEVHPSTGDVALALPSPEEDGGLVPIAPDADGQALAALVGGALAPGEAETLAVAIEAARGTLVAPLDLIPPSAQSRMLTRAQADAEAWFTPIE